MGFRAEFRIVFFEPLLASAAWVEESGFRMHSGRLAEGGFAQMFCRQRVWKSDSDLTPRAEKLR